MTSPDRSAVIARARSRRIVGTTQPARLAALEARLGVTEEDLDVHTWNSAILARLNPRPRTERLLAT